MKPDVFDLILRELGLDDCSNAGSDHAARAVTLSSTLANISSHPGGPSASKRQCKVDQGALRNALDYVDAGQAQKQILVWRCDEPALHSKECL